MVYQGNCEANIKSIAEAVLSTKLNNIRYEHHQCKQLCTDISKAIHDSLKDTTNLLYKIVVTSFIGELQDGGIEAASQCTWEPRKDIMVSGYFKNDSLFAFTNVFLMRIAETVV